MVELGLLADIPSWKYNTVDVKKSLQNTLICVEMLIASIAHRIAFPPPPPPSSSSIITQPLQQQQQQSTYADHNHHGDEQHQHQQQQQQQEISNRKGYFLRTAVTHSVQD